MIEFDQVSLEYTPGIRALNNVSCAIEAGTFTFLTGHSGAGKSSLLRCIACLEKPSSGTIIVGKRSLADLDEQHRSRMRRQMGVVFQDSPLLHDRTVFDNVALPLIIGGFRVADMEKRVSFALQSVGLLAKAQQRPATLSGGEQQRVGIARAVVARPKVLLADEPTGNLDDELSADIMRMLLRFNSSGVTVIMATHDTRLLNSFHFDRLQLSAGELITPQGAYRRRSMQPRRTAIKVKAHG